MTVVVVAVVMMTTVMIQSDLQTSSFFGYVG
jgi:hypothetical protein